MNYGIKRVKPSKKDWVAGAETGIQYKEVLPTGDWTAYLPVYEKQSGNIDSLGCVSFSALNCVEAQFKWLLENKKIPDEALQYMINAGYIIEINK